MSENNKSAEILGLEAKRRLTGATLDRIAVLAELRLTRTDRGFIINGGDWHETYRAPREVQAFLRGYIRGRSNARK